MGWVRLGSFRCWGVREGTLCVSESRGGPEFCGGADCPCGVESSAGAKSLGEKFSGEAEYPGGVAPPVGTKAPCGAEIPGVWVSPCGAKPPVCRSPVMVLILCWVGGLWCGDAPGWAESRGGLAPGGLSTSLRLRHFLPCPPVVRTSGGA